MRGDQGTALIEFALVAPLLTVLFLGMAEAGFAWRSSQSLGTAVQTAARAGSNTQGGGGNDPLADHTLLSALTAALGQNDVTIEKVIVYEANASDGSAPTACLNAAVPSGTGGVANSCNIYSGDWIQNTYDPSDPSAFEPGAGCSNGVDRHWCPENREADQGAPSGPDYLGVWVRVEKDTISAIFTETITIEDRGVARIEPEVN